MRKVAAKFFLVFVGLVILVSAYLIWIVYQPPPSRPNVSISFVGYTNDVSGTRLAQFLIVNHNSAAVIRQLRMIVTPTPPDSMPPDSPMLLHGVSEIGAGASDTFTVRPLTNDGPWKVSMLVYPDAHLARAIKSTVAQTLRAFRLKPRYAIKFYYFSSDWIEGEPRSRTNSAMPKLDGF